MRSMRAPRSSVCFEVFLIKRRANMTVSHGREKSAMKIKGIEFEAKCLKLLGQIAAIPRPLIIATRGKRVVGLLIKQERQGAVPTAAKIYEQTA